MKPKGTVESLNGFGMHNEKYVFAVCALALCFDTCTSLT